LTDLVLRYTIRNLLCHQVQETFFWVIVVAEHTFDDALNTDGNRELVRRELQIPIVKELQKQQAVR